MMNLINLEKKGQL